MVLDTSAVIAILQVEPAATRLSLAIHTVAASSRRMSAASVVEAGIIVQRRFGDAGERDLDALLRELGVEVVPLTAAHAEIARSAFRRFGKGRHPARLNFGDCFSYALARALGEPLLFVGDDFARTDIAAVSY
ncbi:MAG: type II toxin-antitoxin system VapC family toxin [Gemmatimonadetes bacterium]|nr:type II toxin-antitoxin system VapC family toxin [Gemmatimonadota bacterium]